MRYQMTPMLHSELSSSFDELCVLFHKSLGLTIRTFYEWQLTQVGDSEDLILTVFVEDPDRKFLTTTLETLIAGSPDMADDKTVWEASLRKKIRHLIPGMKLLIRYNWGYETGIDKLYTDSMTMDQVAAPIATLAHSYVKAFVPHSALCTVRFRTNVDDLIVFVEGSIADWGTFKLPTPQFWTWCWVNLETIRQIRALGINLHLISFYRATGHVDMANAVTMKKFQLGDPTFTTVLTRELKSSLLKLLDTECQDAIRIGKDCLTDDRYCAIASIYRAITCTPRRIPESWYADMLSQFFDFGVGTFDFDRFIEHVKTHTPFFSIHRKWGRKYYSEKRTAQLVHDAVAALDNFRAWCKDTFAAHPDRLKWVGSFIDLIRESQLFATPRHATLRLIIDLFGEANRPDDIASWDWTEIRSWIQSREGIFLDRLLA